MAQSKIRPYRVDYFDRQEMQKNKVRVHSVVVRATSSRDASNQVHSYGRHVVKAYRFYDKLPRESKKYVALTQLFSAKKAKTILKTIEIDQEYEAFYDAEPVPDTPSFPSLASLPAEPEPTPVPVVEEPAPVVEEPVTEPDPIATIDLDAAAPLIQPPYYPPLDPPQSSTGTNDEDRLVHTIMYWLLAAVAAIAAGYFLGWLVS